MTFSRHAETQMSRRGITAAEVREALDNRETSYPGRPPSRTVVLERTSAGRRVKVVVVGKVVVGVANRDEEA